MIRYLALLPVVVAAGLAHGEVIPQPGRGDPHVQTVQYDAEQVVALRVAPGFAVTVEFSPDERIENVSVGNSGAWSVTANRRADRLFIKPAQSAPMTNMTVVTDVRRYNFNLIAAGYLQPDLPYSLGFTYPTPTEPAETAAEQAATRYKLSGKSALWPSAMSDDGRFTSIVWPDQSTMPAVYTVDEKGHEAAVNGQIRSGAYVIEEISQRFVFRLGKASARAKRLNGKGE